MSDSMSNVVVNDIAQVVSLNQDKVSKICYSLFKKTPISYFTYARIYDSGELMIFCTEPYLAEKLFNAGCNVSFNELNLLNSNGFKSALMSPNLPLPLVAQVSAEKYGNMIELAAEMSLYYSFFILDRGIDNYRLCSFRTRIDKSSIVNFYMNATPLLCRFISYFEHHAQDLIEGYSKSDLIYLDQYSQKIHGVNSQFEPSIEIPRMDFSIKTVGNSGYEVKGFTSREEECLRLIAQGFTMKNTARQLAISHRTVEQHLRNIKDKLGLSTKNQLMEIWHEYTKNKNEEV